jgi:hypothetical protein
MILYYNEFKKHTKRKVIAENCQERITASIKRKNCHDYLRSYVSDICFTHVSIVKIRMHTSSACKVLNKRRKKR